GPFIEPMRAPEFHFDRAWMQRIMAVYGDVSGREFRTARAFTLPRDYVLIHRVLSASVGMLCQLEATGPDQEIVRTWMTEIFTDELHPDDQHYSSAESARLGRTDPADPPQRARIGRPFVGDLGQGVVGEDGVGRLGDAFRGLLAPLPEMFEQFRVHLDRAVRAQPQRAMHRPRELRPAATAPALLGPTSGR